jgi:flagellar assembly factor FliW
MRSGVSSSKRSHAGSTGTALSASPAIEVETPAGRVRVALADVVTFPHGVPGFETCRRFVIVAPAETAPFAWLQGLDAPEPAFLAVDPRLVVPGYAATLTAAERTRLGTDDTRPCLWLAIVRVHDETLSANLAAPIVINPTRMLGLQALAAESPYGTDHALGRAAA